MVTSARTAFFSVLVLTGLTLGLARAGATELALIGTGDGLDVFRAIGVAYAASGNGERVLVPPGIGTGGAIAAIGTDRAILGRISRALSPAELKSGLVVQPLFRLPVAFVVHRDIDVQRLGTRQIEDLFNGTITTWRSLGGPDVRVRLVRRDEADPSLLALRTTLPGWARLVLSERASPATSAPDVLDTVRNTPGAIGFLPWSASFEPDLRVLAIDGLMPSEAGYPAFVSLGLIYKPERLTEAARAFLRFASSAAARTIMQRLGAGPAAE